jgi:hypothetical protein
LSGGNKRGSGGGKGKKATTETVVCYSSEETSLQATAYVDDNDDDDYDSDAASSSGVMDFGTIDVLKYGGDVMVDISASTGGVIYRGSASDDDDHYIHFRFDNTYSVAMSVVLREGCTTGTGCASANISPVPSSRIVLLQMEDYYNHQQDDWAGMEEGGIQHEKSKTINTSGKFYVPNLEEGTYLIQIEVELETYAEAETFDYSGEWFSDTGVVLGPHITILLPKSFRPRNPSATPACTWRTKKGLTVSPLLNERSMRSKKNEDSALGPTKNKLA